MKCWRDYQPTQERGNLVLWNHRNRADTTDPIVNQNDQEQGEEEIPTTDVEDNSVTRSTGVEALLQNRRMDQGCATFTGLFTASS